MNRLSPPALQRLAQWSAPGAQVTAGIFIFLAVLLSLLGGKDLNWDLLNYHYYNGWALLHGRSDIDVAPAQLQTYFDPLLDVPLYLAIRHLPPLLVGAVYATVQSVNAWLVWLIARRVLPFASTPARDWAAFGLGLMALGGTIFRAELGGGMGDTLVSIPLLGAVAIVVSRPAESESRRSGSWMAAGLLTGLACALKLVAAVYAAGFTAASFALATPGRRWRPPLLFAASAAVSWAILDGWWRVHLWRDFGNPLFPAFNQWFASPLLAPVAFTDPRFVPHSWVQALIYPLYWLRHPQAVSDTGRFLDLRLPLLFVTAVAWLIQRVRGTVRGVLPRGAHFVLLGCAGAYGAWIAVFGIHRYLATLELLAPLALVLLLCDLGVTGVRARAIIVTVLAFTSVLVVPMKYARGGWSGDYFGVSVPASVSALRGGTVLIGGTAPVAFVLPELPAQLRFVRIASNFYGFATPQGFDRGVAELVAADRGDLYTLAAPDELEQVDAGLARLHLRRDTACAAIGTAATSTRPAPMLAGPLLWCAVRRE